MVLAQPADQSNDRALRWRQLVELVAKGSQDSAIAPDVFEQAIAAIESDRSLVDEKSRIAAALAIASLPLPTRLVQAFAADRLTVAAPVLAATRLTASAWADVATAASPECRRFIDSLGEEPAAAPSEPSAGAGAAREDAIPSISEIIARIDQLRQSRLKSEAEPVQPATEPAQPAAEAAEPPRLFRWQCDANGEIGWVDGVPRGAVIGRSIARGGQNGDIESSAARAFSLRMPFREARLEVAEGSVASGSWKVSGTPAFDPASGRFCGYRGIAERNGPGRRPALAEQDSHSLRELVHELKTPLNAIIGFAEIISGQYLGPAGQPYRERAGDIVGQARLLLTAIDDLDFAARLQAEGGRDKPCDFAAVIDRVARQLGASAASFEVAQSASTSLAEALSERLVRRFCEAVISLSDRPQAFTLARDERHCILAARNPGVDPTAEPSLELRLLIGLARLAGGDLDIAPDRLELQLPAAEPCTGRPRNLPKRAAGPVAQW